jgi:hypothetical protein
MSEYKDAPSRVFLSADETMVATGFESYDQVGRRLGACCSAGPDTNAIKGVFPRRGVLAGGTSVSTHGNNFFGLPTGTTFSDFLLS